jgi:hypothetical protein
MNEKELIQTWNDLRNSLIKAQLAPTLFLGLILALGTTGHLDKSSPSGLRIFAIGLVLTSGIFSAISILSTNRDAQWVIDSLANTKELSLVGEKLKSSGKTIFAANIAYISLPLFNFFALCFWLYR